MVRKMLKYAVITNLGNRDVNEDSAGVFQNQSNQCFVLCDGLGGHGMGDVASSIVKDVFGEQFYKTTDMVNFVGQTFGDAQNRLMEQQKLMNVPNKMKTTAVVMATDQTTAYIGHVGDSRLYIFQKNKVKRRTLDHSIPQMLVMCREIKEKEIRNHPDRNMLLRVMGVEWNEAKYELLEPIPLKKCQAFLLCSDGFWELIEEKDMCLLLKKAHTVEEWLAEMTEVVKQNGIGKNMDNYTAIAIWNL